MSVQRFAMDPRSGKYAEPMDVALAVTILSEMADEWSWDDDPHGYCHTRRPIVALLNAHDDHERALAEAVGNRLTSVIFHSPDDGPRAFALVRSHDVSGVSGTGTVAYGVEFPDGTVALRWVGGNPTSVVFHDNGMASVEAIHGHGGHTKVMWLSEDLGPRAAEMDECEANGYAKGLADATKPRVLGPDDPEPGVGSVVLDRHGDAWQRVKSGVFSWRRVGYSDLTRWSWIDGPLRLIHDGGAA